MEFNAVAESLWVFFLYNPLWDEQNMAWEEFFCESNKIKTGGCCWTSKN